MLVGGTCNALLPNGASAFTARTRFARLLNDPATQSLVAANASEVSWTRGGSSPEGSQVTFELSSDGGASWTPLGDGGRVGTTANWQRPGLSLPASGKLRARGRTTGGYYDGSSGLIESVANFGAPVISPPVINPQSLKIPDNGLFQFSFRTADNLTFNVLATTNASLPASNWTMRGGASNVGGGLYPFADPAATNYPGRYYRLPFP